MAFHSSSITNHPSPFLDGDVGQECHVACPFDRDGKPTLVSGTRSGQTRGGNLPPLGDVARNAIDLFVVDLLKVIRTKPAGLSRTSSQERGLPPSCPQLPVPA